MKRYNLDSSNMVSWINGSPRKTKDVHTFMATGLISSGRRKKKIHKKKNFWRSRSWTWWAHEPRHQTKVQRTRAPKCCWPHLFGLGWLMLVDPWTKEEEGLSITRAQQLDQKAYPTAHGLNFKTVRFFFFFGMWFFAKIMERPSRKRKRKEKRVDWLLYDFSTCWSHSHTDREPVWSGLATGYSNQCCCYLQDATVSFNSNKSSFEWCLSDVKDWHGQNEPFVARIVIIRWRNIIRYSNLDQPVKQHFLAFPFHTD